MTQIIKITTAAKSVGLSPATLRLWCLQGKVPRSVAFRTSERGHWMIREERFAQWFGDGCLN